MAPTVGYAKHECNRELYDALLEEEEDRVIELCQNIPEGPLHVLTIHGDTVLHMATYSKQKNLVCDLLGQLPEHHFDKLMHKNEIGNTILHEAATSDEAVQAAEIMLRKAPELLGARNNYGETALFRAARYGRKKMFEFLDSEVNKRAKLSESDRREFHHKNDKTTILHMSILCMHFDLALLIAKRYEYLVDKQDRDGMTSLQLLSCDKSAFRSRNKGNYLKRLFYSCMTLKPFHLCPESFRVPLWEAIRAEKQRYESAVQLAEFLTGKDTSWEATESNKDESNPTTHMLGSREKSPTGDDVGSEDTLPFGNPQKSQEVNKKVAWTPLMLATRYGCTEIVKAILTKYPQAVEYVDGKGRNILHLAIEHRHIEIFDMVEKKGFPMIRLIRKLDNDGNTILHCVGIKNEDEGVKDMRSPAMLLREGLLLFEVHSPDSLLQLSPNAHDFTRVREVTATHFVKHFNHEGKTAEQRTFAHVCLDICDNVSFDPHITLSVNGLQTVSSPKTNARSHFSHLLRFNDDVGICSNRYLTDTERWTKIALYSVAFFPVTIFALSYMPLYMSLIKTFQYSLKKLWTLFPQSESGLPHRSWTCEPFKVHKSCARSAASSTYHSSPQSTRYPRMKTLNSQRFQ
ncbi:LOW QUALITY PROTEIN: hypothetical protein RJ639_003089 [Escallonia herrerae]|uniref:Uncharacterized protein n=1 Tax=Escallonia herrerae TaxID=1293975 RepID=A0AA88W126_9ASTE|nr:LOW QUALITY PROTEIN: hypothetical protein RJ639_003089 [Escallonia herrerae]